MSRLRYVVFAIGCAALSAFVLAACKSPIGPSQETGSLQISVTNRVNTRTLVPTIDMSVASYTVSGTGPNGATFSVPSNGGTVTQAGLAVGNWTVVVNAANSVAQLIGTGTASAQVNTGETTAVSVSVVPISGTGALSLVISWPASQVSSPSISASLTPVLGTAQPLAFTISGATASYSNESVGNGYYTLAFTLLDNGTVVAGAVDIVRIVTGQTTSGTYTFSNVNQAQGAIQVNITTNMQDPLAVSIPGGQTLQSVGSTQVLTPSVSNYSGNLVFVWYVNGVSQTTGSSFTFGSGVPVGYYRIDVTAYTADGTQAGSATQNVQVSAVPTTPTGVTITAGNTQATLSWTAVSGATGYSLYWSTSPGVTTSTGTRIAGVTPPYTQTGLTNGTTYYYVVTAFNANGESLASGQASAEPSTAGGITAMAGTGQATISWVPAGGASSYNLYWSTSPGVTTSNGTRITGVTSPFTQGGLTRGTTYYYIVTAVVFFIESPPSSQVGVTPQ